MHKYFTYDYGRKQTMRDSRTVLIFIFYRMGVGINVGCIRAE